MFLPIGDSPNDARTPWVTWALIALNVGIFLALTPARWTAADPADRDARAYVATLVEEGRLPPDAAIPALRSLSEYDVLVFRRGFRPASPTLLGAFTAMFLHGGWLHLLGNMLFLWIYGDNVEHRLGRAAYLVAYLGTGLAAAGGDGLLRWGSGVPSVGASGAISGVLGFYFVWFPHNAIRVWVVLFPLFADVIMLPARVVLGLYLVADNLLPLLLTGGAGGVSYGAHIGGFVAGLLVALAAARRPRGRRGPGGRRRVERPDRRPPG